MARGRAPGFDDQRSHILACAAQQFAERGFAGTSMNQVAEAAGLSKATLYHYCRDKHSLLVSIAEDHVGRLLAVVDEVTAQRAFRIRTRRSEKRCLDAEFRPQAIQRKRAGVELIVRGGLQQLATVVFEVGLPVLQ